MQEILNFLRTDIFLIGLMIGILILLILYIANSIKLSKLRKSYKEFMKRLGNGTNLDEMLKQYISSVDRVEQENKNLENACK